MTTSTDPSYRSALLALLEHSQRVDGELELASGGARTAEDLSRGVLAAWGWAPEDIHEVREGVVLALAELEAEGEVELRAGPGLYRLRVREPD